jgi:hypothetical protein
VEENGPGLGAVRISWKPTGNFLEDRRVEFRLPLEVWNKIVAQKVHEMAMIKAAAETVAKAKPNGKKTNVLGAEGSDSGS